MLSAYTDHPSLLATVFRVMPRYAIAKIRVSLGQQLFGSAESAPLQTQLVAWPAIAPRRSPNTDSLPVLTEPAHLHHDLMQANALFYVHPAATPHLPRRGWV
jgi:hypothetical protein